jgi:hypothetical protein
MGGAWKRNAYDFGRKRNGMEGCRLNSSDSG